MSEVATLGALVVAGVFIAGGTVKTANLRGFEAVVSEWAIVPASTVRAVAIIVPLAEFSVAALILGGLVELGALAALGVLAVLTLGAALTMRGGNRPRCGCLLGEDSAPLGPFVFARNALLAGCALLALAGSETPSLELGLAAVNGVLILLLVEATTASHAAVRGLGR